jgi:hypothetical protein
MGYDLCKAGDSIWCDMDDKVRNDKLSRNGSAGSIWPVLCRPRRIYDKITSHNMLPLIIGVSLLCAW